MSILKNVWNMVIILFRCITMFCGTDNIRHNMLWYCPYYLLKITNPCMGNTHMQENMFPTWSLVDLLRTLQKLVLSIEMNSNETCTCLFSHIEVSPCWGGGQIKTYCGSTMAFYWRLANGNKGRWRDNYIKMNSFIKLCRAPFVMPWDTIHY